MKRSVSFAPFIIEETPLHEEPSLPHGMWLWITGSLLIAALLLTGPWLVLKLL